MYGAGFGWYPGRGYWWYPGRGPGWGWGRGWGLGPGWGFRWAYPGFFRPRGWCWWWYSLNEKDYLQAEKDALEKYLEIIRGRLSELGNEANQEKQQ